MRSIKLDFRDLVFKSQVNLFLNNGSLQILVGQSYAHKELFGLNPYEIRLSKLTCLLSKSDLSELSIWEIGMSILKLT